MRRRVLNAITFLSLVLLALTLAAWGRSLVVYDEFVWMRFENVGESHYRWYRLVRSGAGGLGLSHAAEVAELAGITPAEAAAPTAWHFTGHVKASPKYPEPAFFSTRSAPWGFLFRWTEDRATVLHDLIVPYWFLALLTAAMPVVRGLRWRRRRRERRLRLGLCGECGYDLRASEGKCPECGAAIEPRAA